jgi:hypothetical protein
MAFRAGTTSTATLPTGWSLLASRSSTGVSYLWYRWANGSEGATVSTTLNTGVRASALCYRISGADSSRNPQATWAATNVNDPPSQTASWGSYDNLFLAVLTNRRTDSNVTGAPTNYTDLVTVASASNVNTSRTRISAAQRFLAAASDDPLAFTTTGTIDIPHAATVVVSGQPAPPTTAPVLSVDDTTETSISLSWTSVALAVTYEFQVDSVTVQNTSALSRVVEGLAPATEYAFRVRAVNADGSGPWSATVLHSTLTPPPPPAPPAGGVRVRRAGVWVEQQPLRRASGLWNGVEV